VRGVITALLVAAPRDGRAQLLSPGKLTAAHADLDGLRNCTSCHRLRERGVANDLCLECHAPLQSRIADNKGLHATVRRRSCSECHKEHFGRDFDAIHLDTAGFAHDTVGFALAGSHATVACRDCHTASLVRAADVRAFKAKHAALDRTYLGLGTECESCHTADDPHDEQFGDRRCADCHDENAWEDAHDVDHDRTRYPLTGRHRSVECEECHDPSNATGRAGSRYRGLRFDTCTACHRDPHERRMGSDCESCHTTAGWARLDRNRFEREFDHGTTDFELEGGHADARCSACHDRSVSDPDIRLVFSPGTHNRSYPAPKADDCLSCHVDIHDSVFTERAGGALCDRCHDQVDWHPTTYDVVRHNDGSTFVLEGAHLATPCGACHAADADGVPPRFRLDHDRCVSCHAEDDPHDGQFEDRACDDCHGTDGYDVARFDHDRTRYPLDGSHRDVGCAACHAGEPRADGTILRRFRPLGMQCEDCHGDPQ
jgi:hypothetical protein